MSETISPNRTIAQYTIVSKIGEGGMGEVYRARDTKLGLDVANHFPTLEDRDQGRVKPNAQAALWINSGMFAIRAT
jgi:serine/threonine protein kinase